MKSMANLSMCKYDKCIQKELCHRFNAIPEPDNQQVYMRFENICLESNEYQWFWGDRSKLIKVELIVELIEETKKEDDT